MTVTILQGDVLDRLADLPADHFDCVVTSPPYWGLRDYGVDGQIGLEATLAEHLELMVTVFEAVKRVLKPSGVAFVNYGDCYAAAPNGRAAADVVNDDRTFRDKPFSTVQDDMKPKDLCLLPAQLSLALRKSGWWFRKEIIWCKKNPMPESAKDRPTSSFEKIFQITKQPHYFWDKQAARLPAVAGSTRLTSFRGGRYTHGEPDHERTTVGQETNESGTRNIRDCETSPFPMEPAEIEIWEVASQPFREAHFATFPPDLALKAIKIGCPEGGRVLDPFGGAGTTGLVADRLGLDATLIELNPDYIEIARDRILKDAPMFTQVEVR